MADIAEDTTEVGSSNGFYDLVTALYHALRGEEQCRRSLRDAEAAGDEALAELFLRMAEGHQRLACDAKQILRERIEAMGAPESPSSAVSARRGGSLIVRSDGQDAVQQASEESFPASDAPAY